MKKKINYKESRGLPGGPNEQFTYVTGVFSTEGYKRNSPDVNNPFNIIPSGNITMKGVDFPVMGTDNLGNTQMMMPGNDYQFPGDQVLEIPVAQKGKEYNDATYAKARQEGRLYGLDPTTGDYYAPTLREAMIRPDIANKIYQGQNKFLSGALDLMSAPQKSTVELMTGKYQSPSEAMKITNPIGSFLIDAALDPTNLLGAGLVKRGVSFVKPNLLRSSINNIPIRPTDLLRPTSLNNTFNLEELRRVYHNSERFLQPEEARFLHKHGHGLRENYRTSNSVWNNQQNLSDREIDILSDIVQHNNQLPSPPSEIQFMPDGTTRTIYNQQAQPSIPTILNGIDLRRSINGHASGTPEWNRLNDIINEIRASIYKPKSVNKSGLTKEEALSKASSKDKDAISKMSKEEFENTVLKPTGEVVPYEIQPDLMPHFTGNNNVFAMSPKEYADRFNERLDLLNDIIAQRNKSGVEYRVKGIDEHGNLTFYTPKQSVIKKVETENFKYLKNLKESNKRLLAEIENVKANPDKSIPNHYKITEWHNKRQIAENNKIIENLKNKEYGIYEEVQNIPAGESTWSTGINPGQWKGNVEDIANTEYFRSIPGLEMRNTTSGVFADRIPRRGTGAYESINEYLKRLDLGRVKPGFNSQTNFSRGAWENFIKSGRAVGFYNNPNTVYGTMKSIFPYLGAGYLGYEGLQEALQEKQYGGDNKGTRKLMRPGKNYQFPGDMVFEIPMAQVGQEVMINEGDGVRNIISTNSPQYRKAYKEGRLGVKYDDFIDMGDMREAVVTPYSPNLARDIMGVFDSGIKTAGELTGLAGTARFIDDPVENLKNAARFFGKTLVKGSPYTGSSVYGNVDLNTQVQYTPEELEGFFNTLDASGIAGAILAPAKAPLQAGLKQAAKYATTKTPLRNAWQYNPFAPKLGKYNRVVGQDAVEDMATSGLVRVNNHIIPYTPSIANSQDAFNYLDAFVRNKKLGTTRKQHLIDNIPLQDKIAMQNVEGDIIRRVNTLNGLEVVDNKLFKLNAGSNKKSLHFTHGAPVQSHLQGAWDAAPTTYIMPAKDFGSLNGMPRAVASGDTYWYNPRQFEFPKSLKVYTGDMEHAATLRNAGYDVTFDKESFKLNKKIKALQANPKAAQYGTPEYNELTSLSKQQAALHNAWVKAQNPKPIDVYDTKNIKLGTLEPDTYDSFDDLRSARNKTADAPYIHSETPEKKEWNNLILKDYKSKDADFILQQAKQNRNDYNAAIGTTSEEQWKKAIAPKTNKTLSHVDKMQLAREIMATDIKDLLKLKQAIEINPYTNISDNFRLDLINNRLQTGTNLYRYQTGGEYKVKSGDTFYGIANRNNISWEDLKKANPDINIENLKINQVIKLPRLNAPKIEIPSWASLENISPVSFQDNTFAVKPFVNNVPMFQTETKPEEKPEEKQEPSRYEKLKEQYLKDLKIQENSVKKGWNEEKQLWFPYKAVEKDGGYDIGFGHKILRGEDFSKGLTQEEVIALMLKDYKNKRKSAESFYNRKGFDRKWEDLDPTEQILLTDYQYNAGLNKFPKFLKAVANKDKNTMLKEYIRYSDGKPLVERNKWTKSFIENTLNYQKGGDVPLIKAQEGKGFVPIYVDNPNDPRLKAYKDSLALYNSPYSEKLENVNPNNVDYEKGDYFNSLFGNDDIKPIAITKSDARPIYKKPVQPYVYRNPEIIAKQQELIKAGYDIGGADGLWGPKSQAAWDEYTKQKEVKQPQIVENKPPIQTIIPRQKPQREYDNSNKPFVFLLGNAAYATYDDATAKDFARDLGIENPQRGLNKNIDSNTGLYREYNKATANKYSQKLKPLENGGELNVYEDYINGMYDGTSKEAQAQKIYDKLNRVYYRNAKELGMTPPNYIMSKVIRS